jgi:hypothetical protein
MTATNLLKTLFGITILLYLGLWTQTSAADDLSTTNRQALGSFWTAAEERAGPVTVLSFGDSMADSLRSIAWALLNLWIPRLGVAGFSFNNYANNCNANTTNGTQALGPNQFWFSANYQVPPGGGLWWSKETSPGGLLTDHLGVYYVAQPDGGTFTLSVSTNSGPWGSVLAVDGYSPVTEGRFTNIDLDLDWHRLRVDGQTGTNYILGARLLNYQTNGLNITFIEYPGIGLSDVTNVPLAIRSPVFAALAPDLLIWHMKEDGSDATRQRLVDCEQWWSNAIPCGSVLYVGTPYISVDTNSTWTIDQNTLVRSVAVTYGRAYVDCMTPCHSYWWMVTNGYMLDETHENPQGSQYLANIAWNDLGFFALRTPRVLAINSLQNGINLNYQTTTGILYSIESSPDFVVWQPLSTNSGDGLPVSTNLVPSAATTSYRLRLQPAPN